MIAEQNLGLPLEETQRQFYAPCPRLPLGEKAFWGRKLLLSSLFFSFLLLFFFPLFSLFFISFFLFFLLSNLLSDVFPKLITSKIGHSIRVKKSWSANHKLECQKNKKRLDFFHLDFSCWITFC